MRRSGVGSAPPPANDDFAAAETVTGVSWEAAGSALAATSEPGEPAHGGVPAARTVWLRWVAPVSARYGVLVYGNVSLGVYTGAGLASLAAVPTSSELEGDGLSFTATAGTEYRIAVNWSESEPYPTEGQFALYADSDALEIAPAAVDFGAQVVSATAAARTITVRPIGGLLSLPPVTAIRGPHAADFSTTHESCADGVCTLALRFAPSALGRRDAELLVGTWLGAYGVPLTGVGAQVTGGRPTPPPARPAAPTGKASCKLVRNTRRGARVRCSVVRSPAANGTVTGALVRGRKNLAKGRAKLRAGRATLVLKTTRRLARGRYRATLSIAATGARKLTLARTLRVR